MVWQRFVATLGIILLYDQLLEEVDMKQGGRLMPIEIEERVIKDVNVSTLVEHNIAGEAVSPLLYLVIKRGLDIVISLFGILLLSPLFILVAVCIKLDDGGPVLHFREIVGFRGRRFRALKFRTMILDADGYLLRHPNIMKNYVQNMKLENDPRITRVGRFLRKTSIDELPQLFNVLWGQMSLVGPRIIHPASYLAMVGMVASVFQSSLA